MKSAFSFLLATLVLPVICFSQFNVPDLSAKGDFLAFAKQIEHRSPLLQKVYAANIIRPDMSEEEAKELINGKLGELNNPQLNEKYRELSGQQLKRIGIILYAIMNGLSNVDESPGYEYKAKFGFGITAFMMFTLANFILMPELGVLFRAYGQESSGFKYLERFTYLTLAFTAMYIIQAQTINFLVGISPTLGYALSGIYKFDDEKEDIDFDNDGVKRVNIGLGITAGIMLQSAIMIRLLYNFGLSKIYENADPTMYMFAIVLTLPLWTLGAQ